MNKFLQAIIALMIAASPAFAQSDAISKFLPEYESGDNITTLSFSGKAFEMLNEMETDNPEAAKAIELTSQIKSLRVIMDDDHPGAKNSAKRAHSSLSRHFEDLVTVSEKNALIYVMVDEADGIVSEVMVIVGSEEELILVSMMGAMKLKDVGELTSHISSIGTEVFAESSVSPSALKVYPNPVANGNKITVDLPKEFDGGSVAIFDSNGREVLNFNSKSQMKKIDTGELGKGIFVLKAKNGDLEITRKFVVQ